MPQGKWTPPEAGDAPEEVKKILAAAYKAFRDKHPAENQATKTKGAKIAWGAVHNAGWSEDSEGKWTKKKKEMAEEIVIDAFKAGDYPQGKFGTKELSEIAETYDPDNYEAPILIGHLSDPSYKGKSAVPAFGWIGKVKVVGDHLKLVASQFSDELKDFIKKGLYKKVSAAFYDPTDATNPTPGKWHLHHLAFLGGVPPAVKGLEGIQFVEYSIQGVCIEMQEVDTEVEVDGSVIDTVEEIGTDDTITDLEECCATFLSKIQDALKNDIDYDTLKSRCQLAASDLSNEIFSTLNMHWMFQEKLENLEEHQEAEMSEKKKWLVKFKELFTKRKETEMDAQERKQLTDEIGSLKAKVTAFEEEKTARETAAATAAAETAKAAKVTAIKTFCEEKMKPNAEGKVFMTPAMREVDEPVMVKLVDNPEALTAFQQKYSVSVIPTGEVNINAGNTQNAPQDKISKAKKYIKDNPAEFKELTDAQALRKALLEKV